MKRLILWTRSTLLFLALATVFLAAGCSGDIPVAPGASGETGADSPALTQAAASSSKGTAHGLWGYWEAILDRDKMTIEMVPLRNSEFHMNVVGILNSTMGVAAVIDLPASDPAMGKFTVDVTLTHPFATSPQLAGFDVKGIMITPGTQVVGNLVFAGPSETRLTSADGYTRWWNPTEFHGSGMMRYIPGNLGTANTGLLTATVNPYQYFCDYLGFKQPIEELIEFVGLDDDEGRGVFTAGSSNTRRYFIWFQMSPGPQVIFNYAVDASWAPPVPNPPGEIPDDFPMEANQPEAFYLLPRADVNTLGFEAGTGGRGNLLLTLEVYDWQGQALGNIADEVSTVRVFAPELFSGGQTMSLVEDTGVKAVYSVDLSGIVNPARSGEHQVIFRVGSNDGLKYNSYAPGAPDQPLSAYQVLWVNVEELECGPDGNNTFATAEPFDLIDSAYGTLCRPGGELIDYSDYYSFEIPVDKGLTGSATLYAWSNMVFLSVFDSTHTKLTQSEISGGKAQIDLGALYLMPGTYYLRVLTMNEVDTIYYYVDLIGNAQDVSAPVIVSEISGYKYPRSAQNTLYEIGVTSVWPVTYSWTVEQSGLVVFGPDPGDGNGHLEVKFSDFSTLGEAEIRCEVTNGVGGPVSAVPYPVWVNGQIFHADLNDDTTGDNVGWTHVEQAGTTAWTLLATSDTLLQGEGRKFGEANTNYTNDSSDILVSPPVSLPSGMGHGIIAFRHSYDLDITILRPGYEFWKGYDGGNVKITEAPELPSYDVLPAEITGGMPCWSQLVEGDTLMEDQQAFCQHSNVAPDPFGLTVSAASIPPAMAGKDIYIGFAVTTGHLYANYRGWLIDDVEVYVEGDAPNQEPDAGPLEGGDLTPDMGDPLHYAMAASDPDGDAIYRTWSLWDFRYPGVRVRNIYYDPIAPALDFVINDFLMTGYSNRFKVTASVTDGFHEGVKREAWTVGGGVLFWFNPDDPAPILDHAPWDIAFDEGSDSTWHGPAVTDSVLGGYGYKFADADTDYTTEDQAVIFTPPIFIPPGFSEAIVGFAHYYQLYDDDVVLQCYDGGNVHIVEADNYLTDFHWTDPPQEIVGSAYDCQLESGSLLGGQDAFCDDESPAAIRISYAYIDPLWLADPMSIRIGFAASSSLSGVPRRGWLIDEVVLYGVE